MKTVKYGMLAFALGSAAAMAANQGQLGSTSTADFGITAQGPVLPRQVQILNVVDMTLTNSTRSEVDATYPGATMYFCAIDTYSGAMSITVTSANGASANPVSRWLLKTTSNDLLDYTARLALASNNNIIGNTQSGNSFTATVTAGYTVSGAGACGSGNLKFHVNLDTAMPQTFPARNYIDTVTMVASPV
jgi:hypothetical protein